MQRTRDPEHRLTLRLIGRVPAGFPSPAEDYVEGDLDLERYVMPSPSSSYGFWASGKSMEPLVQDGDLLIVNMALEPLNRSLVVAVVKGDFTLKRFLKTKTTKALVAENDKYPPIILRDADSDDQNPDRIWGVVERVVKNVCPR